MVILEITPVPKPRQTQCDRWKGRDCVLKYRGYCDRLRELLPNPEILLEPFKITYVVPFPRSYSKKLCDRLIGQPNRKRPDLDNYNKAFLDAFFSKRYGHLGDDGQVSEYWASKVWGDRGRIIVVPFEELLRIDGNKINKGML